MIEPATFGLRARMNEPRTNVQSQQVVRSKASRSHERAARNRRGNGATRCVEPPMIANINENPCRAARTTDSGLPPTPIHVGIDPDSVCGYTERPSSAERVLPFHVTGCSLRN